MIADIAAAVGAGGRRLNRYPDREATELRADLAAYLKANEKRGRRSCAVWAANGSNEVMHQLLQAFGGPGAAVLGFAPTYSMYPQYCSDTFTQYLTERARAPTSRLDADEATAAVRARRPVITLLTSPNNPTGTALPLDTAAAVLDAAAEQAASSSSTRRTRSSGVPARRSALGLLDRYPNLVVTRTMSKAFAYAGARLGYLVAGGRSLMPCASCGCRTTSRHVTQAVATCALAHADELLAQVETLRAERDATVAWLRGAGFGGRSDANFVLFGEFADRHAVWQGLLDRGVLIREVRASRRGCG